MFNIRPFLVIALYALYALYGFTFVMAVGKSELCKYAREPLAVQFIDERGQRTIQTKFFLISTQKSISQKKSETHRYLLFLTFPQRRLPKLERDLLKSYHPCLPICVI